MSKLSRAPTDGGAGLCAPADQLSDCLCRYRYGTCFSWCELILAFRSLVTVCVFFVFERHRNFLYTALLWIVGAGAVRSGS